MFKNMKIRVKLILGFVIVALLAATVGWVGYNGMGSVMDAQDELAAVRMPSVKSLLLMMESATNIKAQEFGLNNRRMSNLEDRAVFFNNIKEAWETIDREWKIYEPLPQTELEEKLWKEFVPAWEAWKKADQKVVEHSKAKDELLKKGVAKDDPQMTTIDSLVFLAVEESRVLFKPVDDLLGKITDENIKAAEEADVKADASANSATILLIIFIAVAVVIAILLGILTSANINKTIKELMDETQKLVKAAVDGKLDTRGDPNKINFEFREIVDGVNKTLDAVIGPLNVAAEYVDRISKGDIPPKITDNYNGDFNEIKNNLNQCIESLSLLLSDMAHMSKEHDLGDIDVVMDAGKFQGAYRTMAQGVNNMVNGHISVKKKAMACFTEFGNGNLDAKVEQFPGKKAFINDTIEKVRENIKLLVADAGMLAKAAAEGKLDTRADATRHQGDFRVIVDGVNKTLDNVIGPLNVAAEYVDRISKGDIPPRITDNYNGDFNEIKNNLNQCIDSLNLLLSDMAHMSKEHDLGDIDVVMDITKFFGAYKAMAEGVNKMVNGHISVKKKAMACIAEFGNGNFDADLEKFPGKKAFINNTIEKVRTNLKGLIEDMNYMSKQHDLGDIDVVMPLDKYENSFKVMAAGVNDMVNGHISVKKKAMACFTEFGKGNLDAKIEQFPGKKAFINETIEKVRVNIKSLVADARMLATAAAEGKLDTRADVTKHEGDFRVIVEGVNRTLDNVIGPLNVAAEYVDRISKGDIPPKITDEYKGDFNEIKNNLNLCIDAVNMLVADAGMLTKAAAEGRLETRADASRHGGDFRAVVEGINNTLDYVLDPINEGARVLETMATGDLSARVTGDYKGGHAKIKESINTLGDSLSSLISQVLEMTQNVSSIALQMSSTAETMAAGSQEQAAQADDVSTAVEEMSRTITENAMSAHKTVEEAEKNKNIANDGGSIVEQTVQKMKDIAGVVSQSAQNMEKLGESSTKIGEIISVIDDIADQTNLLALNAAIEAARAGEQGRGFAVVADEVRKLAERTTEATKQIADMIKGIQAETQNAVKVMNIGNQEVTNGIQLADKAGKSLQEIVLSSQDVQMMINQIAVASEEQSSTSEEIAKNVQSINQVTNESAKRIQDIAESSDNLARMIETLNDLLKQFKVNNMNGNGKSGYMGGGRILGEGNGHKTGKQLADSGVLIN